MPAAEVSPLCMLPDVSRPCLSDDVSPFCNLPEEICAAGPPPCRPAAEVSPLCMPDEDVSLFISRLYVERRSILPGFIESEAASILRSTSLLESLLSASSRHLALSAALYSTNGCLASFQQPQSYLAPLSNLDSAIITALIFFFWQSPPRSISGRAKPPDNARDFFKDNLSGYSAKIIGALMAIAFSIKTFLMELVSFMAKQKNAPLSAESILLLICSFCECNCTDP